MKNLFAAFQFITVFPLGPAGTYSPRGMIPWFPVVGLILGGMLCLLDQLALLLWSETTVAVLDVIFLVAVTGAFHLDGLGDAADGLLSHRPREKALLIMKDSRIGAMALVVIVCILALKWAGITSLHGIQGNAERILLLMLIPAYARGGMLFGIRFLPYGRPDGGTGHDLFEDPLTLKDFGWMLLPIGISISAGWRGIWLNVAFAAIVAVMLFYYRKKMNCITGDMLGAMAEITEALLFVLVAIGG
jgi:adenosylcobinamide-GDP ribazoletransferase